MPEGTYARWARLVVGLGVQATRAAYLWRAASPDVPTKVPIDAQDMPASRAPDSIEQVSFGG